MDFVIEPLVVEIVVEDDHYFVAVVMAVPADRPQQNRATPENARRADAKTMDEARRECHKLIAELESAVKARGDVVIDIADIFEMPSREPSPS